MQNGVIGKVENPIAKSKLKKIEEEKKMKKEIMNLLKKEEGTLKLNKDFVLRRYTKDAMNNNVDKLVLEASLLHYNSTMIEIESRNFAEIKEEIKRAMNHAIEEYKEEIIKNFEVGYLN